MTREALARHPLAIAGALITTAAAVVFIALVIAMFAGLFDNPYAGLVVFVAIPAVFVLGLLLIPLGMWLEGRYRFSPRMFVAARADRLDFSRMQGTLVGGGALLTWDAPVQRIEAGFGWYLMRNLVGRTVIQRNWRDGGRVHSRTFVSGQLAYWF